MLPGSLLYAKMTRPTEGGCDRSPSRFVKGRNSPYVKTDSKRSSTLISCPYDQQCESTAPDFAGLISHGAYAQPLLAPFLEPEPYPMPDYAEDTVIYPLEMPEFDYDIFGRSCVDDL
ncbi:hypothetical protein EYR40_002109 [Pleurotus pulmonarius]|nr:hypothetical protein EYR36_011490 [Pleurotus pulmonarius]KAF4585272.1 hypothetical protein EYR40_002109 [Pleurotus pulmonarius]